MATYRKSEPKTGTVGSTITARELAFRWRISERTLLRMRTLCTGPPWMIISGSVRYSVDDVLDHEKASRHGGGV